MTNPAGYRDPTAEKAIANVTRDEKKTTRYLPKNLHKALRAVREMFSLVGYDIVSIKIRDRENDKCYLWDEWK